MNEALIYWAFYGFFLLVRIPANIKRGRLPFMRGPGYFFNTRVPADFFAGPGRDILRRYRLWLLVPFVVDVFAVPLIYLYGSPIQVLYLAMADVVIALTNNTAALKRAIFEARAYETEATPQAAAVAFSLVTRRLRDYTSLRLELIIASINLNAAWTVYSESRWALGALLVLLYVQFGLLLLKTGLIAGRTILPREDAEQYLAWREAYRKLLTGSCDGVRLITAVSTLLAVLGVELVYIFAALAVMLVGWVIWYTRSAGRFMERYRASRPVKLPGALEPETSVPPMICYRPQTPLSFVRGARGWALNLANRRTQVGVAYLIGFVVVRAILR